MMKSAFILSKAEGSRLLDEDELALVSGGCAPNEVPCPPSNTTGGTLSGGKISRDTGPGY